MSNLKNRIKTNEFTSFIDLNEAELNIYSGSGWHLAHFVNGELVALFDPSERAKDVEEAISLAVLWLKDKDDVYLTMCSGCQLCELHKVSSLDASSLAKMARVFGETL